ncbi:MAG: FIST N-terminal domain-containing protein, partial [Bermanella sp.]
MQIEQYYLEQGASWQPTLKGVDESADLLLCFGPAAMVGQHMPALKLSFPNAVITGCTTAGEILDDQVRDDSISLSALSFNS